MSQISPESAVTPYRETVIRFDVADPVNLAPPYRLQRLLGDIARGPSSSRQNVRLVAGVGWQLAPLQIDLSYRHERVETADATLLASNGALLIAPGHVERPLGRKLREIPGWDDAWANVSMADSGDIFIRKTTSAGGTSASRFAADESAWPTLGSTNMPMDRIAVGTAPHEGESLMFSFICPGTPASAFDVVACKYFHATHGISRDHYGTGYYRINFMGDGRAMLQEWAHPADGGGDVFVDRYAFRYCAAGDVPRKLHRLAILISGPTPQEKNGSIEFLLTTGERTSTGDSGILGKQMVAPKTQVMISVYAIPREIFRVRPYTPPPKPHEPIRVDTRRDLRPRIQVQRMVWPTSGLLIDDPACLDFVPFTDEPVRLDWIFSGPAGTAIVGRLFDPTTGLELTEVERYPGYAVYRMPTRKRGYQARFEFTGPGTGTPTFVGYSVVRDAVGIVVEPGEFEVELHAPGTMSAGGVLEVSLTGAEADPSHESGSLSIEDLTDDLTRLRTRGDMVVSVETKFDPLDRMKTVRMARLMLMDGPEQLRKGKEGRPYPSERWTHYDAMFTGAWARLSEALSTTIFDWQGPDPNAPADADGLRPPYKATDAIRSMLYWCGFPPEMVRIPDLPTRLFPAGTNDLFIEPLADYGAYITKIAREILGMYLAFDASDGTYGCWLLLGAPTLPYTNLARFTTSGPGPGKLAHSLLHYPTDLPTGFIVDPSLRTRVRKPEGNFLVVTGTGILRGATGGLERLTQVAYNFRSFNFANLPSDHPWYPNPEHPDYIPRPKPIYVVDPALQTEEAVNFVLRRVFDVSCLAIKILDIESQVLPVVDPTTGNDRLLRFYDPVLVEDLGEETQWLVRNCNPRYHSDRNQAAAYELQAPREPFV